MIQRYGTGLHDPLVYPAQGQVVRSHNPLSMSHRLRTAALLLILLLLVLVCISRSAELHQHLSSFYNIRNMYWYSIMLVIDSKPSTQQLFVNSSRSFLFSPNVPRFLIPDEVYHADITLKMSISGHVLVISTWRTIVREAQSFPIPKMCIQQPLVCSIKTYTPLCQSKECVVVTHVRFQGEHTAVETVRPTYVWSSRKSRRIVEQFVWSSQSHDIRIYVHYILELGLPPKGYLGERGDEVCSVHEVEIGRGSVYDTVDRYYVVIYFLLPLVNIWISISSSCARALSSSIVDPATLSMVTRIANCFFVPLSLKEWASTMAPGNMYQHQIEF